LGKPAYLLDTHNLDSFHNKMATGIGMMGYKFDSSWSSFAKVQFATDAKEIRAKEKSAMKIPLIASLSQYYYNYIASHSELKTQMTAGIFDKHGWVKDILLAGTLYDWIRQRHEIILSPQLSKGEYYLIISVFSSGTITPTHNSQKIRFVIE
jgi:hypothetical protein